MAQPATTSATTSARRRRPWTFVALLGATVVYVVSLPFAILAAMMSPMAFDSGESPAAWALLGAALGYPFLAVATVIVAWVFYARGRYRAALLVLLVPLLGTPLIATAAALTLGR